MKKPVDQVSCRVFRTDEKEFHNLLKTSQSACLSTVGNQQQKDRDLLEDINAVSNQAINCLIQKDDHLQKMQNALDFRHSHEELVYQGSILALLRAIKAKDELTGHHIERMVLFSIELASVYGVSDLNCLKTILYVAALHDIGKVGIRDEVLHKPGFLTADERAHIETHSAIGANIVASLPGWDAVSQGVMGHHEWWDGSGYPNGWARECIPLEARIVALADVFDAVTSLRPYREPFPYFAAKVHIERETGTHFEPDTVAAFLAVPEARWETLRRTAEHLTLEHLLKNPLSRENIAFH